MALATSRWSSSFCSCLDDFTLMADIILCFPCQAGRQYAAITGHINEISIPMTIVASILWSVSSAVIRSLVVKKYRVGENVLLTLTAGCFCPVRSLSQSYKELNVRGSWPGGTACVPNPAAVDVFYSFDRGYGAAS